MVLRSCVCAELFQLWICVLGTLSSSSSVILIMLAWKRADYPAQSRFPSSVPTQSHMCEYKRQLLGENQARRAGGSFRR